MNILKKPIVSSHMHKKAHLNNNQSSFNHKKKKVRANTSWHSLENVDTALLERKHWFWQKNIYCASLLVKQILTGS